MKSVQDYINDYRSIAENLEITGDSVEVLVQLLAHWSYLHEMELVNYVSESSLELAALTNSKIQHCVDRMYSVFRGSNPRVKLRFIPHKYLKLKTYDQVYSTSGFSLYYLGDPITIVPTSKLEDYTEITCILAKNVITEEHVLPESNRYYVDMEASNLSNDGYVEVNGEVIPMYRRFSDHIKYGGLFDLTLPSYGMRIYAPDVFRTTGEIESMNSDEDLPDSNTTIVAHMFEFVELADITSGLDKIKLDGTEMPETALESETYPGITVYSETPRDTVISMHYKANRDRYVNSILRSNLDIGTLVEEVFPDKVIKGGTTYEFSKNESSSDAADLNLTIYYIPYDDSNLITQDDIDKFKNNNLSYYVTENLDIVKGEECTVRFDINVELYQNKRIDEEVEPIVKQYEDRFNIDLDSKIGEIETAIAKIDNVRSIIRVREEDGTITPGVQVFEIDQDGNKIEYVPGRTKYCKVEYNIISTIYRREL